MAALARILLGVPATSVPSERLFSSAGELLSKKRLRMKPALVNKILFLRENTAVGNQPAHTNLNVLLESDESDTDSASDTE